MQESCCVGLSIKKNPLFFKDILEVATTVELLSYTKIVPLPVYW